MGTDIELFAEEQRVDGWHFLGEMGPNTWPMTEAEEIEPARRPVGMYDGRNRALFHLLGFDGHGAHEAQRLPMIAPLRGLPPNLSPEIRAWRRYFDGDSPPGGWTPAQGGPGLPVGSGAAQRGHGQPTGGAALCAKRSFSVRAVAGG